MVDMGCQAGQPMLGRGGAGSQVGLASEAAREGGLAPGGKRDLPTLAVTSLCEIKFNRKDVKPMNTLMCRRLVAALYQVKADLNSQSDKDKAARKSFPEFVPDQFVVLYGIKSIAIGKINEFLYGLRENRSRTYEIKDKKKSEKITDEEPLL